METNSTPTAAQRIEALAEKIGADVHKLVDEFESFVEKEIAKARGEEAPAKDESDDKAELKVSGTAEVVAGDQKTGDAEAGTETAGNAEQNTDGGQPASDSTAAAADAEVKSQEETESAK